MRSFRLANAALAFALGAALTACQSQKGPYGSDGPPPRTASPEMDRAYRPMVETLERAGGPMDPVTSAILLERQTLGADSRDATRIAPAILEQDAGEKRRVTLSARNMALPDVLKILVDEGLGGSYVIDPELSRTNQTVTLEIDLDMSDQDIRDLLSGLAALHGWTITETTDGILFVGPAARMARLPDTPIMSARAAIGSDEIGLRAFHMSHVSADVAAKVCTDLMSEGGKAVVAGSMLVLVDRMSQLNRLASVLSSIDRPAFEGVHIWTYELAHLPASDAVSVLGAIARAANVSTANTALMTFVPVPHLNRLMVVSRDATLQRLAENWVRQVDQPPGHSGRGLFLYRIQHLEPTAILRLLQETFRERLEANPDDPAEAGVRIVPHAEEDLLVIKATPPDFADIHSFLSRVDTPRQQVEIQAIIAEVTLSDNLEYGVEYFLQAEFGSNILELVGNVSEVATPAGSAFLLGTDGFALIEALQQKTEVSLVQTPKVFASDKGLAEFQFGADVPVITAAIDSDTQQGGTTGIRNEIEYRETGIILNFQPSINENGDVTLTIEQEVLDAVSTVTSGIDSPTFTVRSLTTTVTVPHGHTLLLAGVISSRDDRSVRKIPLLGDIPFLGLAFQGRERTQDRTEYLLTVTPTVVNSPKQANEQLSRFLDGARALERSLVDFDGALPEDFSREAAIARAEAREARVLSALAKKTDEQNEPAPAPKKPGPETPMPTSAVASLREIAGAIDGEDEASAAIALFLTGLSELMERPIN